jgi:hypothetical protein|tara:strand:- start:848 stop:1027 length:180 start_codon:yes stop_codon:yes gene_type:complete
MFTLIVDIATWYAHRRGVPVPQDAEWNWYTRSVAILVWPIGVVYFVVGLITALTNNNKK